MLLHFGMSRRILLVMTTSLTVACAVAWAGYQERSDPVPQPVVQQPVSIPAETISVLVAASSLTEGDALADAAVDSRGMLAEDLDETFLPDTPGNRSALAGLTAQRAVPKGTPFVQSDLASRTVAAPVTPPEPLPNTMAIRKGMRAISVPVSAETAVAGLLAYDDRVDVMVSYEHEIGVRAVRTVLRNVRVVATDQRVGDVGEIPKQQPKTITLELHPEGAKVLALALRTGDLVLVLSPPTESEMPEIVEDAPMLSTRISGERQIVEPAPVPNEVKVVRGSGSGRQPSGLTATIDTETGLSAASSGRANSD